jgi:Helix-turn-helix domain
MEALEFTNLTLVEQLTGLVIDLRNQFEELKKTLSKSTKDYYTRKEVVGILEVNQSTLHNWKKQGILSPVGIGGRVYYKKEDIDNAMVKLI